MAYKLKAFTQKAYNKALSHLAASILVIAICTAGIFVHVIAIFVMSIGITICLFSGLVAIADIRRVRQVAKDFANDPDLK